MHVGFPTLKRVQGRKWLPATPLLDKLQPCNQQSLGQIISRMQASLENAVALAGGIKMPQIKMQLPSATGEINILQIARHY